MSDYALLQGIAFGQSHIFCTDIWGASSGSIDLEMALEIDTGPEDEVSDSTNSLLNVI